ncbi:MAG TPA: DUF4397 domain-containing protein [Gemmatimonadales bacterium]|nr:DUF4397 domain-containing protein [Gemmatimonadales bacterium]
MTRTAALPALLCALALSSCSWYDKNTIQNIAGPVPAGATARVRFLNDGVGSPGVNFYADDQKLTAIYTATGQELTTGVTYGGLGDGGYYVAIAPGSYTLKGKNAATTDTISRVTTTLADGKAYSFYQSGIYNATNKTVDAFVVEDPFVPAFDYSVAYVRFVHAIGNASPMTLYATIRDAVDTTKTDTLAIGAQIAYKSAGAFTPLPEGFYGLFARYGTGTTAITNAGVSFLRGRVYTVTARGDSTITSATDSKRPILDNTANR